MAETCVACKINPASVYARVANKNTGALSGPAPLCEECLNRISQTRNVEIVSKISEPEPEVRQPAPQEDEVAETPEYLRKIRKIYTWINGFGQLHIVLVCIFALIALFLFVSRLPLYGAIALGAAVSSVVNAIVCHILCLAVEAVDDYLMGK